MKRNKINYVFTTIVIVLIFAIIPTSATADLESGLKLYLKLNGNGQDSSGQNNNAINYGATSTLDQFGRSDGAYYFDPSYSYMKVPHDSSLNVGTGNYTFSFWININNSNSIMSVLDKRDSSPNWLGNCVYIRNKIPYLQIASTDTYISNISSGKTLTPGNWSQVIIIVDRSSTAGGKFIIDGSLVSTFNPTIFESTLDTSTDFYIGSVVGGTSKLGGKLDNIRFYNRALSTTEAEDLYGYESIEQFELKGVATMADTNSNGYSEIVSLLKSDTGTIVKIHDSSTGTELYDLNVFNLDWTPRSIAVVNADGTGNEDIAVTAVNMSTNEVVIRRMTTGGSVIGDDIDLIE